MAGSRLVVFGDSVNWGQGLVNRHKCSSLVREGLARKGIELSVDMQAHSGATIGARGPSSLTRIDGEVPVSAPTVMQQVRSYDDDPDAAAIIIMNGGINDVDIRVILNPLTSTADLRHDIQQFCYHDMRALIMEALGKFPGSTRIVVNGYYPVLSKNSHPLRIPFLLQTYGVGIPSFLDQGLVFDKIVALCMQFWSESSVALQHAVRECNAASAVPRVKYAAAPFTIDNAVFAGQPWLFGLDGEFNPQDEVIAERHAACDRNIDAGDLFGREGCYRASAGHPNPAGARAYADAILAGV